MFVELLLSRSIAKYKEVRKRQGANPIFFDRGIPDVIAYAACYEFSLEKFKRAAKAYEYNKKVFLLSPWEEIYVNDDERKMTFEYSMDFNETLVTAYRELDYQIVEVPQVSVSERAKFIESSINET